jgi:DNA polymerase alpha subunit A
MVTVLFRKILEHILSGDEAEIVVEHIHDYLTTLGQEIRNGSIDLEDFIIFKVS